MTSCLLLSERTKKVIDDESWTMYLHCSSRDEDTWRGAFTASCLTGLLWPVYNWWVEWIRDEFVTVSHPDGDRQSSSLALLIWLMMTMMVMMMLLLLPWLLRGLCLDCASPLSSCSLLPFLDGMRGGDEVREKHLGSGEICSKEMMKCKWDRDLVWEQIDHCRRKVLNHTYKKLEITCAFWSTKSLAIVAYKLSRQKRFSWIILPSLFFSHFTLRK